jgi:hypothetical protein
MTIEEQTISNHVSCDYRESDIKACSNEAGTLIQRVAAAIDPITAP